MSNNEKSKSEDPTVQKRLARLDHADCIELARELTTRAREEGAADMSLCACMVEDLFEVSKPDLYALIDGGAIEAHESEDCSEPILWANDIRLFFEKLAKTNEKTPSNTERKKISKSEDPRYFVGLQNRLSKLDHAKCIRLAQEQTDAARKRGGEDMVICACKVEELFGIKKRDMNALADIGAFEAEERDMCSESFFRAQDIRSFFECAAKRKEQLTKSQVIR